MKLPSLGLVLILSAMAMPARASVNLPQGYSYYSAPKSAPRDVKRKSLDFNDAARQRVTIGAFEYDLYSDTHQAIMSGRNYCLGYNWNEYDETFRTRIPMEEYEAAFPGGKLSVPATVDYNGESYTVVKVAEFGQNPFLKEVDLPETLLRLESNAFSNTGLTKLRIPDSVIEVGYCVCSSCPFLTELYIGKNMTNFAANSLGGCSITSLSVHPENEYFRAEGTYLMSKDGKILIGNGNRNLEVLDNIPTGVEELAEDAFRGLQKLKSITLPSSLIRIRNYVFMDCPLLTSVTIPEGLDIMGNDVFSGTAIKELILPESLTWYAGNSHMSALEKLYLGKNLEYIGGGPIHTPYHSIAMGCPALKEVIVNPENRYYMAKGANFYTKNGMMLGFSFGRGEVNSPIDEATRWIGPDAFTELEVGSIVLPENLWRIDGPTFDRTKLEHPITVPATTRLLSNTFIWGYEPKEINIASIVPPAMDNPQDMLRSQEPSFTFHVPQGCADNYTKAEGWKIFNIVEDLPLPQSQIVDFDYCGGYTNGSSRGMNTPAAEYAIRMTAEQMEAYRGKAIGSVQFWNSFYRNFYSVVYRMRDGKVLARQDGFPCELHTWNSIVFSEPYVIDPADGDILIGYGAPDGGGCEFSRLKHPDGNWFREIGGEWMQGFCGDDGAWQIIASITDAIAPVDARIRALEYNRVNVDGTFHVSGKIENNSHFGLTECELAYTVTRAGATAPMTSDTITLTHNFLPYHEFMDFEADIPLADYGNLIVELKVASINGQPTEVKGNGSGPLDVVYRPRSEFSRNVVVEEATGTWCSYCPLGIAAIEQMKKEYGNRFIPICLHDDEMRPDETYNDILDLFSDLPGSIVDRKKDLMPYPRFDTFKAAYRQEAEIAECAISATAEFADENCIEIIVNTHTTFVPEAAGTYLIACVMLEDGWGPFEQQSNYTAEELGLNCDFSRMMYDDVARSIHYPMDDEPEGNITNTDDVQSHSIRFATPENVTKLNALKVVVMVINRDSGEIENACTAPVARTSALTETAETTPEVQICGLAVNVRGVQGPISLLTPSGITVARTDGDQLMAPAPGLYILSANNLTRKLIIH